MLIMKIKLNTYNPLKISFYTIASYHFIIITYLNGDYFLKLPSKTQVIKKKNLFYFISNKFTLRTLLILRSVSLKILNLFKKKNKLFCKKLLLKGLGFRVISIVQNQFLELKIGFSHFVKILIPKDIKLYNNKNMILIEGEFKDKVGNFANKIKSFRMPDSYKGKGIWYKNEIKVLKEVKKS